MICIPIIVDKMKQTWFEQFNCRNFTVIAIEGINAQNQQLLQSEWWKTDDKKNDLNDSNEKAKENNGQKGNNVESNINNSNVNDKNEPSNDKNGEKPQSSNNSNEANV